MNPRRLQQFGTITTSRGVERAMLSVDADRVDEGVLQWRRNPDEPAFALTVRFEPQGDSSAKVVPVVVHRVDSLGRINIPDQRSLTAEEKSLLTITAELKRVADTDGFTGRYMLSSGQVGGDINLQPFSEDAVSSFVIEGWADFKAWCTTSHGRGFSLFRGHGDSTFRLKTTFHRLNRNRMGRFWDETLAQFRLDAEAATGDKLSLDDSDDAAQLIALGQHHGLPTPMLDLSTSPYVAAFFAFSDALDNLQRNASHVRIYALSQQFVSDCSPRVVSLNWIAPYVSGLGTSARINPRLRAQQGSFLVTNVSDLESFICSHDSGRHIIAVDLPMKLMIEALTDLRLMNISAATVYPGIDGVCRQIRQEMQLQNVAMLGRLKASQSV